MIFESGITFNCAIEAAASAINDDYAETSKFDAIRFPKRISGGGETEDLILVARKHPAVNTAVRGLRRCGIPVVCLTACRSNSAVVRRCVLECSCVQLTH